MAAEEQTTWGEVCSKVGFSDNLYQTCRDKVPGYTGTPNSAFDSVEDVEEEDFGKALRKSAKPVPAPPAADWQPEPEGFFEALKSNKMLMYGGIGGIAALAFWLMRSRSRAPQQASQQAPALRGVTRSKAA